MLKCHFDQRRLKPPLHKRSRLPPTIKATKAIDYLP